MKLFRYKYRKPCRFLQGTVAYLYKSTKFDCFFMFYIKILRRYFLHSAPFPLSKSRFMNETTSAVSSAVGSNRFSFLTINKKDILHISIYIFCMESILDMQLFYKIIQLKESRCFIIEFSSSIRNTILKSLLQYELEEKILIFMKSVV